MWEMQYMIRKRVNKAPNQEEAGILTKSGWEPCQRCSSAKNEIKKFFNWKNCKAKEGGENVQGQGAAKPQTSSRLDHYLKQQEKKLRSNSVLLPKEVNMN